MKIVQRYLNDIPHTLTMEDFHTISIQTQGWSGSDLESLTREASMTPIRECIRAAALLKRRSSTSSSTSTASHRLFVGRRQKKRSIREQQERQQQEHPHDHQHQCGGVSTAQHDPSSRSPEKEQLLERFSNLRPVNVLDFMNAMAFWAYNHGTSDAHLMEETDNGTFQGETIHYDSSSDEED